jgi:hypothetical protein
MDDLDFDLELSGRLAALEARAPVIGQPPHLTRQRRSRRLAVSVLIAPALALAVVATTAAGVAVVRNLAQGHEGIENPGQPLAGANLECMTPPAAAAFLAARGYRDVVWQVESGSVGADKGAQGTSTSALQAVPPEHGFVVPGAILDDGKLHMIVDQRSGASGVGACFGYPMP